MSAELVTSRDVMAELTRHRLASFCIESQRYVCMNGEIAFILPRFYRESDEAWEFWEFCMADAEQSYHFLLEKGLKPEDIDAVLSHFAPGDYLLMQNELSNFTYLLRAAVGRGLRVVLNASPISGEVLAADLTGVDWLVVNEIECAAIAGCSTPEEGYAALRVRYPGLGILLTLGSEGSVSWKDGVEIRQCAYPVQAVDTTGAGDTFMGYFVGCLAQGMERKDAMQYAAMAASIAVTRPGAAPSIPMMAEVRAAVEAL